MTRKTIDVRGKDCPQPVIETRQALQNREISSLKVLVSDEASAENVARTGRSLGCDVKLEDLGAGGLCIVLNRGETEIGVVSEGVAVSSNSCGSPTEVVVLVASDRFGQGDDELGRILMLAFVKTLATVVPRPRKLIFLNSGVKLTTEGSDLVEAIGSLENSGMEVLSCGTCLDFYGLKERLQVGTVSNMFDIASALVNADRVIRP